MILLEFFFFAESLVVLELVKIIVGNKFATKDFA
jgi:hypothetical protein